MTISERSLRIEYCPVISAARDGVQVGSTRNCLRVNPSRASWSMRGVGPPPQLAAAGPSKHAVAYAQGAKIMPAGDVALLIDQKPLSCFTLLNNRTSDMPLPRKSSIPIALVVRAGFCAQNRVMFAAGGFGYFATLALYSPTAFNSGPSTHSYISPMLLSSRGSASMLNTFR